MNVTKRGFVVPFSAEVEAAMFGGPTKRLKSKRPWYAPWRKRIVELETEEEFQARLADWIENGERHNAFLDALHDEIANIKVAD